MKTEQPAALATGPHSAGESNVPKLSPWLSPWHAIDEVWSAAQVSGGDGAGGDGDGDGAGGDGTTQAT